MHFKRPEAAIIIDLIFIYSGLFKDDYADYLF